ncbi:MAG: hypothetical protein ACLP9S_04625 [Syntrophales bacterium]
MLLVPNEKKDSVDQELGSEDKKTEERLSFIEEKGKVTSRELAEQFGVSATAISQWTSKRVKDGIISWCDENGYPFIDDKDLKKAKHSGKAYLKIAENYDPSKVTGLPSPFDLTNDPDWDKDGKLRRMYDLDLDKRLKPSEVFIGVKDVFDTPLNTMQDNEPVNPIPESDDEDTGVKVFVENPEDIENNFEEVEYSGDGDDYDKGIIKDEKLISRNDIIDFDDALSSVLENNDGNGNGRKLTPSLCRGGCKHYDGVKDVKDGKLKEYCWRIGGQKISNGCICGQFESKEVKQQEGVLQI